MKWVVNMSRATDIYDSKLTRKYRISLLKQHYSTIEEFIDSGKAENIEEEKLLASVREITDYIFMITREIRTEENNVKW